MVERKEIQVGDETIAFEYGKLGKQANGAVTARSGDTIVFAAATMSADPRTGIDFFPLTCDYEERMYSVGKIPGGFYKLEAMLFGHAAVVRIAEQLQAWRDEIGKPKSEAAFKKLDPELLEAVKKGHADEIRAAVQNPDKAARESGIDQLKKEILQRMGP